LRHATFKKDKLLELDLECIESRPAKKAEPRKGLEQNRKGLEKVMSCRRGSFRDDPELPLDNLSLCLETGPMCVS
jgi:hypothetical protein